MEYGKSIFLTKPNDPIAAVFTPEAFGACPDGTGDNTAALQRAIDEVVEKHYHGIIYVPEGTYRFTDTVQLWRGIRLIGYGASRPVFILAGSNARFMRAQIRNTSSTSATRSPEKTIRYAMRRIRRSTAACAISISTSVMGNAGAVACRYRIAQLCSLEDIDFHINDAYAGG